MLPRAPQPLWWSVNELLWYLMLPRGGGRLVEAVTYEDYLVLDCHGRAGYMLSMGGFWEHKLAASASKRPEH